MSRIIFRALDRETVENHIQEFIQIAADVPLEYWQEEHFLIDLPDKWMLSIAAWVDDVPVGYAVVSRKSRHHAHLHHFMLAKPYRGSGAGAGLIAQLLARCRDNDCSSLSLKVHESNKTALGFYERQGFAIAGKDADYIRMEARIP